MKQYQVKITDEALADMERIYNHIAQQLLEPEYAMGQYNRIADAVLRLKEFPERFRLLEPEPWHSMEMRRMIEANPIIDIGKTASALGVTYNTASTAIQHLSGFRRGDHHV